MGLLKADIERRLPVGECADMFKQQMKKIFLVKYLYAMSQMSSSCCYGTSKGRFSQHTGIRLFILGAHRNKNMFLIELRRLTLGEGNVVVRQVQL